MSMHFLLRMSSMCCQVMCHISDTLWGKMDFTRCSPPKSENVWVQIKASSETQGQLVGWKGFSWTKVYYKIGRSKRSSMKIPSTWQASPRSPRMGTRLTTRMGGKYIMLIFVLKVLRLKQKESAKYRNAPQNLQLSYYSFSLPPYTRKINQISSLIPKYQSNIHTILTYTQLWLDHCNNHLNTCTFTITYCQRQPVKFA